MHRLIPGSVIAGEISNWISSIRRTGKERHIHVLYDALEAAGCDVTLLALDGAEHADLMFFQDEVWQQIIAFFKRTLRYCYCCFE